MDSLKIKPCMGWVNYRFVVKIYRTQAILNILFVMELEDRQLKMVQLTSEPGEMTAKTAKESRPYRTAALRKVCLKTVNLNLLLNSMTLICFDS